MKDNSYVVIQSFMLKELGLKGNELIVYAIIYGFTQDGSHWYYGTRGYLAEWCGAKRETVDRCLKSLIEKGYVERREVEEHGRVFVQYRATKNVGGTQKSSTPPQKTGTPTPKTAHINNLEENLEEKTRNDNHRAFTPPTLSEVTAYCEGKGYRFDPSAFFDYYEASGWTMQNGKKVKNWKQCCVTWERNCKQRGAGNEPSGSLSRYNYF